MLYKGATTRIIAHEMAWFDGHTHTVDSTRMPSYKSNDPVAVKAKLSNLKAAGVVIISPNWYGPNNAFIDQSCAVYLTACESLGLKFFLDIDGNAFHDLTSLRYAVGYARLHYLPSSAYEKWQGRFIFTVFVKDLLSSAFRTIEAENPDCVFVFFGDPHALNQMAWIQRNLEVNLDWWIRTYGLRKDGSLNIPCVAAGFNDLNSKTGKGVWGADPARIYPPGVGQNPATWGNYWATINNYFNPSNQLEYLQLVTVGDRDEGTDLYQPVSGQDTFIPIPPPPPATRLEVWVDGKKAYEQQVKGNKTVVTQQVDSNDKVIGKTTLLLQ